MELKWSPMEAMGERELSEKGYKQTEEGVGKF